MISGTFEIGRLRLFVFNEIHRNRSIYVIIIYNVTVGQVALKNNFKQIKEKSLKITQQIKANHFTGYKYAFVRELFHQKYLPLWIFSNDQRRLILLGRPFLTTSRQRWSLTTFLICVSYNWLKCEIYEFFILVHHFFSPPKCGLPSYWDPGLSSPLGPLN